MIEKIEDVPTGVVGLRASGKLSRDDYRLVLEPTLRDASAAGDVRFLFVLVEFDGLESGAWIEDAKTGLSAMTLDRSAWKRFALVTDAEWVAKAIRIFGWLIPGEVETFASDRTEDATKWVAS